MQLVPEKYKSVLCQNTLTSIRGWKSNETWWTVNALNLQESLNFPYHPICAWIKPVCLLFESKGMNRRNANWNHETKMVFSWLWFPMGKRYSADILVPLPISWIVAWKHWMFNLNKLKCKSRIPHILILFKHCTVWYTVTTCLQVFTKLFIVLYDLLFDMFPKPWMTPVWYKKVKYPTVSSVNL